MIGANFSEKIFTSLIKDILRRIVIYANLFLTFYVGKNESESDRLVKNKWFNILSVSVIILSLVHYKRMYTITDIHYCHDNGTLTVSHGGQITSVIIAVTNIVKIVYFGYTDKGSGDGEMTYAEGVFCVCNLLGIGICYIKMLKFDYTRGVFWHKILIYNHMVEYFVILIIFFGISFFMPEQLIESTFKLCLIGIVLVSFRDNKSKLGIKDIDAEFLEKVSNLYFIYFAISVIAYFHLQDLLSNGIEAFTEIYEKKDNYYIVPFLLGILCTRYKFYFKLKTLIYHTTFNDFDCDHSTAEIFLYLPSKPRVTPDSMAIKYFMTNLLDIMQIGVRDISEKSKDFFMNNIENECPLFKDKLRQLRASNRKLDPKNPENKLKKNKFLRRLKARKTVTFFQSIYMSMAINIFDNFEFIFRFVLQILCTVYIYKKTCFNYSHDVKTFMRVINFPIILVITFWNLFSSKVYDHAYLKNFSIFVVIPVLFLQEALNVYFYLINRNRSKSAFEKLEDFLISLFTIHIFLLISSIRKNKIKNTFMMKIENTIIRFKQDLKFKNANFEAFILVLKTIAKSWAPYIICSFGIAIAMFEASILDIFLIMVSLNFILEKNLNKMKWLSYILYIDFLILSK